MDLDEEKHREDREAAPPSPEEGKASRCKRFLHKHSGLICTLAICAFFGAVVYAENPWLWPHEKGASSEAAFDPANLKDPDGKPLAECLPYEGMPEAYIDYTLLGRPDEINVLDVTIYKRGGTWYTWKAHTGADIFLVFARNEKVEEAYKKQGNTDYWLDPVTRGDLNKPNLDGTGAVVYEREPQPTAELENNIPTPEELSDRLPYIGLPADLVDSTWLGPHSSESEPVESGMLEGATPYHWVAHDGTQIFAAYIRDGKVIKVAKFYVGTDYWNAADGSDLDKPNLDGTGTQIDNRLPPQLVDPEDFDNAEDYADNAADYFEYYGAKDPWMAAVDFWDLNGP